MVRTNGIARAAAALLLVGLAPIVLQTAAHSQPTVTDITTQDPEEPEGDGSSTIYPAISYCAVSPQSCGTYSWSQEYVPGAQASWYDCACFANSMLESGSWGFWYEFDWNDGSDWATEVYYEFYAPVLTIGECTTCVYIMGCHPQQSSNTAELYGYIDDIIDISAY